MNFTTSLSALNANMGAFGIIATILAIIATVAAFILVVPESKREKLGRFGKFLHDAVNFKFLIVEKILQALYIFVTAYLILCGFFMHLVISVLLNLLPEDVIFSLTSNAVTPE